MEMNRTVENLNLNDLIEYSDKRQVRKKFVQTDIIVSEIVCYEPGQVTKMHVHPHQDEIFYCMEGGGAITFAEQEDVAIFPGSVVFVPSGIRHGAETAKGSRLVIMFTKGPGLANPTRNKLAV